MFYLLACSTIDIMIKMHLFKLIIYFICAYLSRYYAKMLIAIVVMESMTQLQRRANARFVHTIEDSLSKQESSYGLFALDWGATELIYRSGKVLPQRQPLLLTWPFQATRNLKFLLLHLWQDQPWSEPTRSETIFWWTHRRCPLSHLTQRLAQKARCGGIQRPWMVRKFTLAPPWGNISTKHSYCLKEYNKSLLD